MIAAIGALSGGPAVGSETVDYVARIAELRRQLAAIQRKLAEAAKGGASELNTITQQSLAQQVVALQAHIAVLQLRGADGKDEAVLFDFNHPLAGQPVTFEVQLIGVL